MSQFLPLPALLRLIRNNTVDPRYRKRARSRVLFSAALEPLRWYENVRWGRQLRRTKIEPPVFLLGFGRSGTTHLHNLLWQDPQFGVVTNYQAILHPIALIGRGWLSRLFEGRMPSKRPMDNVAVSLDSPQEEEIALINATDRAALHFMSFPRALPDMYDRYVCGLGEDEADLEAWKCGYLEVLQKATILSSMRRLVLKTPPNTGRVRLLTQMFPGAKYAHIVRNPYLVYQSMRNMYRKILPSQVLQEFDWEMIDRWMADAYKLLMKKYLSERSCVPPGDLFEVRYEELDEHPIEVLGAMYRSLGLGDFTAVRPRFEEYLDKLGTYEKNRFDFPEDVVETVNDKWGFAFDAFGYDRLEPGQNPDIQPAPPASEAP